ncbi:MAG: hypothetical protein SFZ02_18725 [bacterium]|nr:hypothetical protein [bacterium]
MNIIKRPVMFLASRWWLVLGVALVNVASFLILFSLEGRFEHITGQPVYDTQNDLTTSTLLEQLPLYEGEGRDAYNLFALYDFVFPFVAALFVAVTLTWLLSKNTFPIAQKLHQWNVPLLTFIVTIFDWLENISILTVISYGATAPQFWLDNAILFKRLKLITLNISFASMGLALGFLVVNLLYRRIGSKAILLENNPIEGNS